MRTASSTKASEVLDQLDERLGSLGIAPKRDRWHKAAEMVQRAKERRGVIEQGGSRPPIDNYVDGLFEAMEIHEIMRAFQGNTSAALILLQQRRADWPLAPAALVLV